MSKHRKGEADERAAAPDETLRAGPRAVLRNGLGGLCYAEQVALVRPRGSLPPLGQPVVQHQVESCESPETVLERERWQDAKSGATDSFNFVARSLGSGVETYREMLAENDSPRGWAALASVAEFAASAVLGRLGERLVGAVVSSQTRNVLTFAVKMGLKSVATNVGRALGEHLEGELSEASDERVKRAFLTIQRDVLERAVGRTRETFEEACGLPSNPGLTSDEIAEVERANRTMDPIAACDLVSRELTVAWCNMLAGSDGSVHADPEHTQQAGVLRIVIEGRYDLPTNIRLARLYGAGPAVREEMSGAPLGRWLGTRESRGLTIAVRADDYNFTISPRARRAMIIRGVIQERDVRQEPEPNVYFAFTLLPGGTIRRDHDPQGARRGPAAAGLWFLDHVRPSEILDAMRELPLPEVEAI